MSYESPYYGKITEQQANLLKEFFDLTNSAIKFNVYPNTQLPGSLWYHDHSMATTGFNVRKGLSGMYLLRDRSLEKENILPSREYEQNLLISA